MKICSNIHTHCTWCDGSNTPGEMIQAAIGLGFTDLGFSSHSPAPFDPTCPGVADENAYVQDIHKLKEKYRERIHILCGMEQDTYAPAGKMGYDYIIGSNHFLPKVDGEYIAVDGELSKLQWVLQNYYANDGIRMTADYYSLLVEGIVRDRPDVVGHFDLVKKYNQKANLFNEEDKRYQTTALEALDSVLDVIGEYGGLLEVNTGAMARQWRDDPYPSMFLLRHAAQRKARMIITSDSHAANTLDAHFEVTQERLVKAGFVQMTVLQNGRFVELGL